jgi:hypothetical protein
VPVNQEGGVVKIEPNILVHFQFQRKRLKMSKMSLNEGLPLAVGEFALMQIKAVVDVGDRCCRGDQDPARFEMVDDVVEDVVHFRFRNVFENFPGGDEIESEGFAVFSNFEWFCDVGCEEVFVGEIFPVGAFVAEGVIGAFNTDGLPTEVFKIFDDLSTGATEVHKGARTGRLLLMDQGLHVEHELFVAAVVVHGSPWNEVIGRFVGDGMIGIDRDGAGALVSFFAEGEEQVKEEPVKAAITSESDVERENAELAGPEHPEKPTESTRPKSEEMAGHLVVSLRFEL